MKAHGLALAHRAFVGFWACGLLFWGLFFNVGFIGPSPHGPGPNPVGWAKLTPLLIYVYLLCRLIRSKKAMLGGTW